MYAQAYRYGKVYTKTAKYNRLFLSQSPSLVTISWIAIHTNTIYAAFPPITASRQVNKEWLYPGRHVRTSWLASDKSRVGATGSSRSNTGGRDCESLRTTTMPVHTGDLIWQSHHCCNVTEFYFPVQTTAYRFAFTVPTRQRKFDLCNIARPSQQ